MPLMTMIELTVTVFCYMLNRSLCSLSTGYFSVLDRGNHRVKKLNSLYFLFVSYQERFYDKEMSDSGSSPQRSSKFFVSMRNDKPGGGETHKRGTSAGEPQRQTTWLERTHRNATSSRHRGRVCHEVHFPETFNGLYSAKFSPNGNIIANAFGDGGIQIRNGETAEPISTMRFSLDEPLPIMCCQFHTRDCRIFYASSACGKIFACNFDLNQFSKFIEEPGNEVNTISMSMGGEYLVSGGKDAALRLYDAAIGKIIHIYQKNMAGLIEDKVERFHRMRIFASKFHKTFPELIVSGGWDDTVRIWDTRIGTGSIRSIKGPHICGDALDVHETKIITGSWTVEGSLQLWDMTSGRLIETIIPQNRPTTLDGEFLYTVQYFDGDSQGNLVVAGGSGTGAVEVIDLSEKRVVGNFQVTKAVLTIDTHKTSLVYGGFEPTIRIAAFP